MNELFERIIVEINERKHLKVLLPRNPLTIKFECEDEEWTIILSRENCKYIKGSINEKGDLRICASAHVLNLLLTGEIRLHQLSKYGEINVEGSYRHSLLLESIIWLCRDYKIA
ncbi:SCP2 sterol-binding domain-containing protein [Heyndrickxia sp. NPDC080065]|uniref:SCP2 sterol-binding domain-containing protein n=1 Tax=Heyndrickxia sp. NPDC080065 TaxID=3390568 RepID=UPI003D02D06E